MIIRHIFLIVIRIVNIPKIKVHLECGHKDTLMEVNSSSLVHRLTSKSTLGIKKGTFGPKKDTVIILLLLRHLCSQGLQLQLRIID